MLVVILFSLAFSLASCTTPDISSGCNNQGFCAPTCAEPRPDCKNSLTKACKDGYVYNKKGGKCIRVENCPKDIGCNGDMNSEISTCASYCPPTCIPTGMSCPAVCILGCSCKEGYILHEGKCIKKEDCPLPDCIPTCAEPNPQNCQNNSKYTCESGYVMSDKDGKCIPIEDCPQDLGCNGDPNAQIQSCPPPCPSTCDSPNQLFCKKACLEKGCACKYGFLLDEENGKCIKPEECPAGYPCGKNETFVGCRVECPDAYCPKDDSRDIIACDPPFPCPSGCVCELGYRRTNDDCRSCILAEDCPPIDCTRDNEVYASCPECPLVESCDDKDNAKGVCNPLVHNCNPQCICRKDYCRNNEDACVARDYCSAAEIPM